LRIHSRLSARHTLYGRFLMIFDCAESPSRLQVHHNSARCLVERAVERAKEKLAEKQKLLVDAVDIDELAFDDILK
jgi:hypothetical protein